MGQVTITSSEDLNALVQNDLTYNLTNLTPDAAYSLYMTVYDQRSQKTITSNTINVKTGLPIPTSCQCRVDDNTDTGFNGVSPINGAPGIGPNSSAYFIARGFYNNTTGGNVTGYLSCQVDDAGMIWINNQVVAEGPGGGPQYLANSKEIIFPPGFFIIDILVTNQNGGSSGATLQITTGPNGTGDVLLSTDSQYQWWYMGEGGTGWQSFVSSQIGSNAINYVNCYNTYSNGQYTVTQQSLSSPPPPSGTGIYTIQVESVSSTSAVITGYLSNTNYPGSATADCNVWNTLPAAFRAQDFMGYTVQDFIDGVTFTLTSLGPFNTYQIQSKLLIGGTSELASTVITSNTLNFTTPG